MHGTQVIGGKQQEKEQTNGKAAKTTLATTSSDVSWIPARIGPVFQHFLEIDQYSLHTQQNVWQFAVELEWFRDQGITNNDLRWLVLSGLVQHAIEVTLPDDEKRVFREGSALAFNEDLCFVPTEAGLELATVFLQSRRTAPFAGPGEANEAAAGDGHRTLGTADGQASEGTPAAAAERGRNAEQAAHLVPVWDGDRLELRLGQRIVKRFKSPATNQATVLAAFDEEGWPPRIDDPLPPHPDLEPKRRLHDTINSLNRNQKHRLIRFLGDGSGKGVRWEPVGDVGDE